MAGKIGFDHKVFRSTTLLTAKPEDVSDLTDFDQEEATVREVSVSKQLAEIDMSDRQSFNDTFRNAGENVEYQIQIIRDNENPFYLALETARRDGSAIALAFSTGELLDTEIIDVGNWSIGSQNWGEPRKEAAIATFVAKPRDAFYANLIPDIS